MNNFLIHLFVNTLFLMNILSISVWIKSLSDLNFIRKQKMLKNYE